MIREAIDRILALAPATMREFEGGRMYTDKPMQPILDPMDSGETVGTLTGLVDFMHIRLNNLVWPAVYVHVESPDVVRVSSTTCDKWGRRQTHILCKLPNYGRFNFGSYMGQEQFIIGAQAFFDREHSKDLTNILGIAALLKAEAVSQSDDNGVAQSVTLRKGPVMQAKETVKGIVQLRPYRTFREIEQPESSFIFRLRSREGEVPTLALFEADADMWQPVAMQSIKAYLEGKLPGTNVIA